ncbi:MAG: hypothetical protein E7323_10055 [Clostridiales bacterium]|nr:hypothetical protein [Clostridiales bacterium]
MAKRLISLLTALLLTLCLFTGACAEAAAAFPFTAVDYADAFVKFNSTAVCSEAAPGLITIQSEGGSAIQVAFDAHGQCTALSTQVMAGLGDSEATINAGTLLGTAVTQMLYSERYMELGQDEEAAGVEIEEAMLGFQQLMSSMTEDDYTAMVDAPVTKEVIICGHPATLTMGINLFEMALVMTVAYLP